MAHTWVDGEVITAEKMNDIEEKTDNNSVMFVTLGGTTQEEAEDAIANGAKMGKTWQEIYNIYKEGKKIIVIWNPHIENLVATNVVSEVIGVSGAQNSSGGGLLDGKWSIAFYISATQKIYLAQCDAKTDYPVLTFRS